MKIKSAFLRTEGESDDRNAPSGSTVVAAVSSNSDATATMDLMWVLNTGCRVVRLSSCPVTPTRQPDTRQPDNLRHLRRGERKRAPLRPSYVRKPRCQR